MRSGRVLHRAIYLPFGQAIPLETATPNQNPDYTFTGYEKNDSLSHLDASARNFHPVLGRFNQIDPIDHSGESSYAYAANNPLK